MTPQHLRDLATQRYNGACRHAFIDGYKEAQKWVEYKERMPEEGGEYLVVTSLGIPAVCTFVNGTFYGHILGCFDDIHVTHWQYISPLPKQ